MAPFWKGKPKFLRFGKKKKKENEIYEVPTTLPLEPDLLYPVPANQHVLSPESGDSWRDFPRQTESQMREEGVVLYPPDALTEMNDLLRYEEVERSPHSRTYEMARTPPGYEHPADTRVRSISSLSTVTATIHNQHSSIVGTAAEIDLLVRQSMASRGQPISVAMLDPVDVPPVPPLPERIGPPITSRKEPDFTIPPVFHPPPPPVVSHYTGDPGGIPLVDSPITYATPLPVPPPPISSSAQTAPHSSIQSVPNRFRGPYSERSERIDLPEPSRSSQASTPTPTMIPQPLSPIQNILPDPPIRTPQTIVLEPLQPQEEHHPIELEEVEVEESKVYRSSTGKSNAPTLHSRTYQRALTLPTRITDPMPPYIPRTLAPPRQPSFPSVHRSMISAIRVEETSGMALVEARRALYGSHRKAPKRFFWNLLPSHDQRVVQGMERLMRIPDSIANLGLVKFLETRSRGALMVNLNYIAESDAEFPTADWITFAQAQKTYDYALQESIANYDPAVKTLVFGFLLSRTKNSLAIWRRQFPVPESSREAYGPLLQEIKNELAGKEMLIQIEASAKNPHGTRSDRIGRQATTTVERQVTRTTTAGYQMPPHAAQELPRAPLIFSYPTVEAKTPEPVEMLPMPNAQRATITGTTVHEFGPTGRRSQAVHVFGRSPSNGTLTPVFEEPPKKKGWFKRMFGGSKPKGKTVDETMLVKPRGTMRKKRKANTLTHVEWD
ncbi:hypothetical protein FRB90_004081 [Tulasnella sp. 427]|nr:hypothetical protein FRB90_004081 [Tulasnella sp. 427]